MSSTGSVDSLQCNVYSDMIEVTVNCASVGTIIVSDKIFSGDYASLVHSGHPSDGEQW